MSKVISVFNNKGGVGKTTICWNLADALGRAGNKVLVIDFDPQCNISIAILGQGKFLNVLSSSETIRSFLQHFLQNTGGEKVVLHSGEFTSPNVQLIAGDFWLNVFAESLNVGSDLLTGTGLARYVAIRRIIKMASVQAEHEFDYVLLDLPPSFGALVRAAFYSSDFYLVPCTSDNFSAYCVGLIGQMIPDFINDWGNGLKRFQSANPGFTDFNEMGRPVFAGWIYNGFDTARRRRSKQEIDDGVELKERAMVRADEAMHQLLEKAVREELVDKLKESVRSYGPIAKDLPGNYQIGDIEDANVLIQNSLWLNVPLGVLAEHNQVVDLQNRQKWAENQIEQIKLLRGKFDKAANNIIGICGI